MEIKKQNHKLKVYYDPRSLPATPGSNHVARLFIERGGREEPYRVTIRPAFGCYELKGQVDSQLTRDIVLSIVHTNHPYREIIDHMSITPDAA